MKLPSITVGALGLILVTPCATHPQLFGGQTFTAPASDTYLEQIVFGEIGFWGAPFHFYLYEAGSGYMPVGSSLFHQAILEGAMVGYDQVTNPHPLEFNIGLLLNPFQQYVFLGSAGPAYPQYGWGGNLQETVASESFVECIESVDNCHLFFDETRDIRGFSATFGPAPTTVPEPLTLVLLGTGLVGVGAARRRKREGIGCRK